uniref:Uncharacterized protein n=1 Tax=Tanacetum cinerariifolium TaxID=118510 RepID=A0A699HNV2_TANCI|nr:hypothetical protein [Tanacetum cinerariifolium]
MEALEGELHRVKQRLRKVSNRLKRMPTLLLAARIQLHQTNVLYTSKASLGEEKKASGKLEILIGALMDDLDEARGGVVDPGGGLMEDVESRYQPQQ